MAQVHEFRRVLTLLTREEIDGASSAQNGLRPVCGDR
jgi:hypothetical protein